MRIWSKLVLVAIAASVPAIAQVSAPATPKGGVSNGTAVKSAAPVGNSAKRAARSRKPSAVKEAAQQPAPPPVPLTPEQMPAVPPQVSFQNGQLTIQSQNSTLGDILNSVRQQIGVHVELAPGASSQRIATRLGPGRPRDVIAALLSGSGYDYIILGSNAPGGVQRVMITRKSPAGPTAGSAVAQSSPGNARPAAVVGSPDAMSEDEFEQPVIDEQPEPEPVPEEPQPQPGQPEVVPQPGNQQQEPQQTPGTATPQQPGTPIQGQQPGTEQNQANPNQPQIKTPEQLLQELQRMQQQQQQQQQQPPQ